MTEQAFFWLAGLVIAFQSAHALAFWKHVLSDISSREEIATLRAEVAGLRRELADAHSEVGKMRDRWHDFREKTLQKVYDLPSRNREP